MLVHSTATQQPLHHSRTAKLLLAAPAINQESSSRMGPAAASRASAYTMGEKASPRSSSTYFREDLR